MNENQLGDNTYLDSIYLNLSDMGVADEVIENLADYMTKEHFDTESMDWDLQHVDGNIENEIGNAECIKYVKEMFQKVSSMCLSMFFSKSYHNIDVP